MISIIVIKPGSARQVDLGPGRPGAWTGPSNTKDRCKEKTGQTRNIYTNSPHLSGNLGKQKGKLKFYPNFFLCRSNN